MKSLIAVLVLFTLVSTTAFAQQERLAHLAETLELSTGQ
jgi:hypothetical protein